MKVTPLALLATLLLSTTARAQDERTNALALQATIDDSARQQKNERIFEGLAGIGVGGVFAGLGTGLLVDSLSKSSKIGTEAGAGIGMLIGGGTTLLAVPFIFAMRGDVERLADRTRTFALEGNREEMERALDAQAHRQKVIRMIGGTFCLLSAAAITPIGVASVVTNTTLNDESRVSAGGAIGVVDTILIIEGLRLLISPSRSEQLQRGWLAGTSVRIQPSISPTSAGVTVAF